MQEAYDRREKEVDLCSDDFWIMLEMCMCMYVFSITAALEGAQGNLYMYTFKSAIASTKLEGRSEILLLFCLWAMCSSGETCKRFKL